MATTIQISSELLKELKSMKRHDKESYEDIIWDLIEDRMELSEETKRHIKESEKQIAEGRTISLEELKKKIMRRKCTR
jgi:predicted CopG family antitoxin